MIKGLTFKNQKFSANDFSLMTKEMYRSHSGIVRGINITYSGSDIFVGEGYFITNGYYTKILNNERVSAAGLTGSYKLIYEIDLSKENTEEEFLQGTFKLTNASLIQEDIYGSGKIYQTLFANVQLTNGNISSLNKVIDNIMPDYYGTAVPPDNLGIDGDVYYQYTE